jgi:hypothetical protein
VETDINCSVDSEIESAGLATTERHVGNGALEALLLALLGGADSISVSRRSPLDTLDNVGHGATTVRLQDLDGVDIGLLCNTEFLASNSARAMSAVSVAIGIFISGGNGLSPLGTAFEVDMVNVGAGVNDVGVDALAAILGVQVFVKSACRDQSVLSEPD